MDRPEPHGEVLTGEVVDDGDVLPDYGWARTALFDAFPWPPGREATRGRLSVFQVEHVLIAPCCIPIDLRRRRVFRNHFYEGAAALFPVGDLVGGERFAHRVRPGPELGGPLLVLGGPLDLNYYHWLLSWCSRLAVVRLLAPELLADPGLKVLADMRAAGEPFRAHLQALGLGEERIVWTHSLQDCTVRDAYLVTLPSQNSYHRDVLRTLAEGLRAGFGVEPAPGRRRRIWIAREQLAPPKRRVVNMDALAPVLRRFGIEPVVLETLDPAAQVALFAEAELVVGVHGAGLANLIFSPPDCRVLVIEKPFNVACGLDRTFPVLAEACGLRHRVLVAEAQPQPGVDYQSMYNAHHQDVVVSPAALAQALSALG